MTKLVRPTWDERERLAALHEYDVLDAPLDIVFDDFVQIAAHVCDAPIAVVNLIDANRQWFAAEIGLGVRETPLDISICARAILQQEMFVVPDLAADPRFDCNPLVMGDPRLRFYGGALLRTDTGLPLGTVCVLDTKPRPAGLTAPQRMTLQALARQVMAQFELRRALKQRIEASAAQEALLARTTALLEEKELLLQEVHHRVKNSLATVQSLLTLQARAARVDAVATLLRQSAARINTFAVMHEHLYRVGASAEVDIASYLRSLIADQQAAFATPLGRRIAFQANSAPWASSNAPALGMIVVELVTNALKYGAGLVSVTLVQAGGEAVLTVEDEGASLPPGFDPARAQGLGMRVVTGLLRGQPDGRLEVDRSCGHTRFVVRIGAQSALQAVNTGENGPKSRE